MLGELGELRHRGEAEVVGVGGVDAADERVDQPLVDLVAEAARGSSAPIESSAIGAWQERLGGGAQLAPPRQQRRA